MEHEALNAAGHWLAGWLQATGADCGGGGVRAPGRQWARAPFLHHLMSALRSLMNHQSTEKTSQRTREGEIAGKISLHS